MNCPICNKRMKMSPKKEMYHYTESGLDNVYLITKIYKCVCGEFVVDIPNIEGLHEMIANNLVKKNSPLAGKEFRFIRKQLHLKAKEMALILGVSKVTVSRWENEEEKIGIANDKLIRFIYTQMFQEKCNKVVKIVSSIKAIRPTHKREKIVIPKEDIREKTCYFN